MIHRRLKHSSLILSAIIFLAGCNMPAAAWLPDLPGLSAAPAVTATPGSPIISSVPPAQETLVTFTVQPPPGAPEDEPIFLTLLDEVTGLALNTQPVPMQRSEEPSPDGEPTHTITLPFAIGSAVKYRYERGAEALRAAELLSDGSAVRYRLYHVTGPASVQDVISRWMDTEYALPTGRIQGQAVDAQDNRPIPNLLVTAGGAQTITASDGSFMLEGLPPGVHNLVGYAMDGAYEVFQQGARVADGSTTPTPISLKQAAFINVVFAVKPPDGTPPVVPLRMAGNLSQLGAAFADLAGGMSGVAVNMPALAPLPDGRYTITVALPAGADIRYKYTLGDGFWNAERMGSGAWNVRQLIVPEQTVLIEDTIDAWFSGSTAAVTFDLSVPEDTPAGDFVSIQFNPLFGWTEPIPMWKLGNNRWAYVLYSPLNLPGNVSYRYCRNGQCGAADDAQTPGAYGKGHPLIIDEEPQTIHDEVAAWADWSGGASAALPPVENVAPRSANFWAATGLRAEYHPSWDSLMPAAFENIRAHGANHAVLAPTWTYGRRAPGNQLPILAPLPGQDPSWAEALRMAEQAQAQELIPIIYPAPRFWTPTADWWLNAPRSESWWQVWFEQYRGFALHFADLAARSKAQTLILGGEWLRPALPGGSLPDGAPSDLPADAEARWRDLLNAARARFAGQIGWALSYQDVLAPPVFLDQIDLIYLELPVAADGAYEAALGQGLEGWLDNTLLTFQVLENKPLVLAADCPADPDLQAQVDCYQNLLTQVNSRAWLSGLTATGYYPPVALRDASASVHGKPAEELLGLWYPELTR
ncbi:MAG: hypothetical protein M5U05_12090 [Anaerolineales bacterium]|jgi:hypothetical protein|nr:hypothetical protein [Anaerolineales bacterium]